MKRKLSVVFTVLLCAAVLSGTAGAYDYREDLLAASGEEVQVKELLSGYNGALDYDRAVRVRNMEWEELRDALEGDFAAALENASTVWIIPEETEHSWAYVRAGGDGYSRASGGPAPAAEGYLYAPETVDELLAGQSIDSVYLISVLTWNVDLVAVLDGGGVCFIPYAQRPEFLKVENGSWYTAEEMTAKLSACVEEQSGYDFTGLRTVGIAAGALAGAAVLAALIVTVWKKTGKPS